MLDKKFPGLHMRQDWEKLVPADRLDHDGQLNQDFV